MDRILKLSGRFGLAIGLTVSCASAAQAGDATQGAAVFKAQCAVCHSAAASSGPTIGPRLFGVEGRRAGTVPGYAYSNGMKSSGIVWNHDKLKLYLSAPQATVHGNKMPYAGLHDVTKLENLLSYLALLK